MSDAAHHTLSPHIFIIEDKDADFNIIQDFVREAIAGRDPQPIVARVRSKEELEAQLGQIENQARVLIIFDRLIETGAEESLDNYITDIWTEDYKTWRGKIRIVVYSFVLSDLKTRTNQKPPRRKHRFYVSKLGRGASDPLDNLESAIQDCVASL
jgi:hypothetical protein